MRYLGGGFRPLQRPAGNLIGEQLLFLNGLEQSYQLLALSSGNRAYGFSNRAYHVPVHCHLNSA